MDSTVKGRLAQAAQLALATAALWPMVAGAQALVDPTRPPDAPLSADSAGAAGTRQGPRLQSVLVSDNGRRVAVIDGQTVRVGDRVGGASVASIAGTSVVLRRGKTIETLRLYPKAQGQGKAAIKRDYADQ